MACGRSEGTPPNPTLISELINYPKNYQRSETVDMTSQCSLLLRLLMFVRRRHSEETLGGFRLEVLTALQKRSQLLYDICTVAFIEYSLYELRESNLEAKLLVKAPGREMWINCDQGESLPRFGAAWFDSFQSKFKSSFSEMHIILNLSSLNSITFCCRLLSFRTEH